MKQVPVGTVLLLVTLIVAAASLYIRRTSWGCRWEGAPTLVAAMAGLAAYLTSGHASDTLGRLFSWMFHTWNYEDFLGHVAAIVCLGAANYMFLCRFGDDEVLRDRFTQWVWAPLTVMIPLLTMCWWYGGSSEPIRHFEQMSPEGWLTAYWILLTLTILYLLGCAWRVLLILRLADGNSVVYMYMATVALTMVFMLAMAFHVISPFDIQTWAWTLGYAAAIGWVLTPAISWLIRSRPLRIIDPDLLRRSLPNGDGENEEGDTRNGKH